MVKMKIAGITIEVPASDVGFYKQAGYSVVDEKPAPVAPPEPPAPVDPEAVETPEPAEKPARKPK